MKTVLWYIVSFAAIFSVCAGATRASAHEVYVLDSTEIHTALEAPTPDFIDTIKDNFAEFYLWGIVVITIIAIAFIISITVPLERFLDPILFHLKKYAPYVAQITLGLALCASGYYHAIFGIELPLEVMFGAYASVVSTLFIIAGILLILGIFPRFAALIVLAAFTVVTFHVGIYVLSYTTYAGEALVILLFGGGYSLFKAPPVSRFHKYTFVIMRVLFGTSLIYASFYAKFLHGALALETVTKYNLTEYFHFQSLFLVLGAMLIEILLGLCFMFGFEIRFASIFFLVFLTMSLLFFGEAVWPHFILIGTAIAMFMHGYDRYTLGMALESHKDLEPIL